MLLGRIRSKTVEMKFLDPVASVGGEEFSGLARNFPHRKLIELTPFCVSRSRFMSIVESKRRDNFRRVRSDCKRRPECTPGSEGVRPINECAQDRPVFRKDASAQTN